MTMDNSPFTGIFQPYRGAISTNLCGVSQSRLPSWEPARASEEAFVKLLFSPKEVHLGGAIEVSFMDMIMVINPHRLGYNPYHYGYISTCNWNCTFKRSCRAVGPEHI